MWFKRILSSLKFVIFGVEPGLKISWNITRFGPIVPRHPDTFEIW